MLMEYLKRFLTVSFAVDFAIFSLEYPEFTGVNVAEGIDMADELPLTVYGLEN